jgi:hypothetical protein
VSALQEYTQLLERDQVALSNFRAFVDWRDDGIIRHYHLESIVLVITTPWLIPHTVSFEAPRLIYCVACWSFQAAP